MALLLFTSGQINLKNRRIISMGTRQITSYGTEFCRKLIEDLAPGSYCKRFCLWCRYRSAPDGDGP
jgi:hypothetical protein